MLSEKIEIEVNSMFKPRFVLLDIYNKDKAVEFISLSLLSLGKIYIPLFYGGGQHVKFIPLKPMDIYHVYVNSPNLCDVVITNENKDVFNHRVALSGLMVDREEVENFFKETHFI